MKLSIVSTFAILATLAAGSAFAVESTTKPTGPQDTTGKEKWGKPGHEKPITREEWDKKFDRIDTNHDGVITPDEMKAHHDKWQAMHGKRGPHDGPPPPPPAPEGDDHPM